ncbi:MAG: hypothetical protein DRJ38_01020 [Thermoprotei archaeon]|nr:MAG: hypothetical protein DRJ38_01020 [Thermoprotei archaeon]
MLITGLLEKNSGKTYLAAAILYALRKLGFKPGFFKPISIHNWFTDYDTTLDNLRSKSLYCKDVAMLSQIARIRIPYELLNPIHFLTAPLDPCVFINARVPDMYYSFSYDLLKTTIIARFSRYEEERLYNIYLFNEWALQRNILLIDEEILDRITRNADEVLRVNAIKNFVYLMNKNFLNSTHTCLKAIEDKHHVIIVESYSNVAWPLPPQIQVAFVLAVSPGRVLIYEASKFKMAVELKKPLRGLYTNVKLSDIIGLLKPVGSFKVGPVHSAEIPESYAIRKYASVVNFLISKLEKLEASF